MEQYLQSDSPESQNEPVGVIWSKLQEFCLVTARTCLGVSKVAVQGGKNTRWWKPEIEVILKKKKLLFKQWQGSKTQEDREKYKLEYKIAKKAAKRAVAQAKAASEEEFYKKLDITKDEKLIFKTAKQRHNNCQDIKKVKFIKN
ncbi:uncharacterized protein LOC120352920 [Nilaparvata lugens]|uniref:uncharacterized protein LOC120352920 n=1 Tax=Nilaparvata lugens TaxID=108931 RepID=UPI00193E514E|nr:uncharacterized protein LOC120352920 [Nilaparvata lugens]